MAPSRPSHIEFDLERSSDATHLAPQPRSGLSQRHYATPTPLHSPNLTKTSGARGTGEDGGAGAGFGRESKGDDEDESRGQRLSWRERIRHFTWTWFTMTMATGQIAAVLYVVPYRFHGLYAIGCIFFLLNVVLFMFNVVMISLRFYFHPSTFAASIRHPTESLFIPALIISIGTILTNITQYGYHEGKTGPWLIDTMVILFWTYCALAMCFTCGIYLILWSTQTFTISQMTPVWIFPAYPLLVIGPMAGNITNRIGGNKALDIIIGGFTLQGIGFMVSLMVYSAFLYRLMTQKLPMEKSRPAMFISVGPSGFTVAGVINMGHNLPRVIPANFMDAGELAGTISMVAANWMGLWLWGLAIFFCVISIGAHLSCVRHGGMDFAMTWYSFVFPNTALATATFAVGKALDNGPIRVVGCVLTCLVIVVWIYVFVNMIRAVIQHEVLWPQMQEDRDEGGWKSEAEVNLQKDAQISSKLNNGLRDSRPRSDVRSANE
ncbi:hypothetical protein MBLNU459_g1136t3 [Dothideomycetes sp. NU459]